MDITTINDLMTQINEKSNHIARLERARKSLKGADAERAVRTITNLRQQIIELQGKV